MKFEAIRAQKAKFPVAVMCRCLGVSRSGFYAWSCREPSQREQEDTRLRVHIRAIHRESRRAYGYPRVHRELLRRGHQVGRHRVARLMRQEGLRSKRQRRFRVTTKANDKHLPAPNLLERQFHTQKPDAVWVGDITYIRTDEGWLYLAILVDLFSRRIVGWALSDRLKTSLALDAWRMALGRRGAPGIHHSDRGCQYTSKAYLKALEGAGTQVSMSRKGDCWDNAVAESTFASIKVELVHGQRFRSRAEARAAVVEYVDGFYNSKRQHSANNFLSPAEFEAEYAREAANALT